MGVFPFHYLILVIVLMFSFINYYNKNLTEYFRFDAIKLLLLFLVFINLFNSLLRFDNINLLESNYRSITGNSPKNLYFKVMFNGTVALIFYYHAYNFGKILSYSSKLFLIFINIIIIICLINACANITEWFNVTGGIIGRYNFTPPLVPSNGVSISYSVLGFLMVYSVGNFINWIRKLKYVLLLILLFSILIIITRQAQITFLLILILYTILKKSEISILFIIKLFFGFLFIGGLIFFLYNYLNLTELFLESSSKDSIDYLVRIDAINEGLRIFDQNKLFGIGYGMYPLHTKSFFQVAGDLVVLLSPHNGFVSVICEMGIIGLICSFLLMGLSVRIFLIAKRQSFSHLIKRNFSIMLLSISIINIISFFISNFYLLPPPSEYEYFANSFFIWIATGFCSQKTLN
jgi:O-antigen ligase